MANHGVSGYEYGRVALQGGFLSSRICIANGGVLIAVGMTVYVSFTNFFKGH